MLPRERPTNHAPAQTRYGYLDARIKLFTSLPIASLDKLTLQRRLEALGKAAPENGAA